MPHGADHTVTRRRNVSRLECAPITVGYRNDVPSYEDPSTLLIQTVPWRMQCVLKWLLFNSVSASRVQFRAGSSRRGTGGSLHPAAEVIANPLYDYYTVDFDVALARVSFCNLFIHVSLSNCPLFVRSLSVPNAWHQLQISNTLCASKEFVLPSKSPFGALKWRLVVCMSSKRCQWNARQMCSIVSRWVTIDHKTIQIWYWFCNQAKLSSKNKNLQRLIYLRE
jgi:hypothetical protein